MKKLITLITILLSAYSISFGQDASPSSPKTVGTTQVFYSIQGGDTVFFLKTPFGYARLLRNRDTIRKIATISGLKDSIAAHTPIIQSPIKYDSITNILTADTSILATQYDLAHHVATATNGLKKIGSAIGLGGTITTDAWIWLNGPNRRFFVGDSVNNNGLQVVNGGGNIISSSLYGGGPDNYGFLSIDNLGGVSLDASNAGENEGLTISGPHGGFSLWNITNGFFLQDNLSKGLENSADYSTYEIANDNAYMTRKAVRLYVTDSLSSVSTPTIYTSDGTISDVSGRQVNIDTLSSLQFTAKPIHTGDSTTFYQDHTQVQAEWQNNVNDAAVMSVANYGLGPDATIGSYYHDNNQSYLDVSSSAGYSRIILQMYNQDLKIKGFDFESTNPGLPVIDQINHRGLEADASIQSGYWDNNSYVTKKYVDSLKSSGGSIAYLPLSFTDGDQTVTGNGHRLNFIFANSSGTSATIIDSTFFTAAMTRPGGNETYMTIDTEKFLMQSYDGTGGSKAYTIGVGNNESLRGAGYGISISKSTDGVVSGEQSFGITGGEYSDLLVIDTRKHRGFLADSTSINLTKFTDWNYVTKRYVDSVASHISVGVPASRTLTINGTALDLSANRTWSVGTVTSVSASSSQGVTVSGSPIIGSGTLAIGLGNITPTSINTTHLPTNVFQTPTGTAGTDSLAVKIGTTGKIGAISPTYYATTSALSGYVSLTGSYSNPAWITGLPWSKVTGTPTTVSGYNITDAQKVATILTAATANYTAVLSDAGFIKPMNVATANTYTVPPNSSVAFPVNTILYVTQTGAGQTTITAGSGVTINSPGSKLKINLQYSTVALVKTATDTWMLMGDITN